eukprot:jgi/Chrzof1/3256/Cz12g18030.t1
MSLGLCWYRLSCGLSASERPCAHIDCCSHSSSSSSRTSTSAVASQSSTLSSSNLGNHLGSRHHPMCIAPVSSSCTWVNSSRSSHVHFSQVHSVHGLARARTVDATTDNASSNISGNSSGGSSRGGTTSGSNIRNSHDNDLLSPLLHRGGLPSRISGNSSSSSSSTNQSMDAGLPDNPLPDSGTATCALQTEVPMPTPKDNNRSSSSSIISSSQQPLLGLVLSNIDRYCKLHKLYSRDVLLQVMHALSALPWPAGMADKIIDAAMTTLAAPPHLQERCENLVSLLGPDLACHVILGRKALLKFSAAALTANYWGVCQELQVPPEVVNKMVRSQSQVLMCPTDKARSHVQMLSQLLAVTESEARKMLVRHSNMLMCVPEHIYAPNRLQRFCKLLGITEQQSQKMLKQWPYLLCTRQEMLDINNYHLLGASFPGTRIQDSMHARREMMMTNPSLLFQQPATTVLKFSVLRMLLSQSHYWLDELRHIEPAALGFVVTLSTKRVISRLTFMLDVHGCHSSCVRYSFTTIIRCHVSRLEARYRGFSAWHAVWSGLCDSPSVVDTLTADMQHLQLDSSNSSNNGSSTQSSAVRTSKVDQVNPWKQEYLRIRDTEGGRVLLNVCLTAATQLRHLQQIRERGEWHHITLLEAAGITPAMIQAWKEGTAGSDTMVPYMKPSFRQRDTAGRFLIAETNQT